MRKRLYESKKQLNNKINEYLKNNDEFQQWYSDNIQFGYCPQYAYEVTIEEYCKKDKRLAQLCAEYDDVVERLHNEFKKDKR